MLALRKILRLRLTGSIRPHMSIGTKAARTTLRDIASFCAILRDFATVIPVFPGKKKPRIAYQA